MNQPSENVDLRWRPKRFGINCCDEWNALAEATEIIMEMEERKKSKNGAATATTKREREREMEEIIALNVLLLLKR